MRMAVGSRIKPVIWIGSSKDDLLTFPEEVIGAVGYALFRAQEGNKHPNAKPLHGFTGAGVLEVVEDHDGDTYRAVYTVRFTDYVYVLHAFQKKSKRGIRTTQGDIDLVRARLKRAEQEYAERIKRVEKTGND
jgi:phage-related protein